MRNPTRDLQCLYLVTPSTCSQGHHLPSPCLSKRLGAPGELHSLFGTIVWPKASDILETVSQSVLLTTEPCASPPAPSTQHMVLLQFAEGSLTSTRCAYHSKLDTEAVLLPSFTSRLISESINSWFALKTLSVPCIFLSRMPVSILNKVSIPGLFFQMVSLVHFSLTAIILLTAPTTAVSFQLMWGLYLHIHKF